MATVTRRVQLATSAVLGAARRAITVDAKVVRYTRHGHPSAPGVLKLDTIRIDTAALAPSEVFVRMVAAPITRLDLTHMAGYMVKSPKFPHVAGNEGVGVVEAVGADVKGISKGDYVVAAKPGVGTWATHAVADSSSWVVIPASHGPVGADTFPVEHAAVSVVAPLVAKTLVSQHAKKGDYLIQNGAFSTVGQAVVQYAAQAGVASVNIARMRDGWANMVYHLQGLGAGVTVDEAFALSPAFKKTLADLPAPTLGLNAIGGRPASVLASSLANNGTIVTYGGAPGNRLTIPVGAFTSKTLTYKGFSLEAYINECERTNVATRAELVKGAIADVAGGDKNSKVKMLLAREPFADFPHAMRRALSSGERKVVLIMPTQ